MTVTVTEPGFHYFMDEVTYHGDPVPERSLSSTMARLLTRHVPAKAFARRNMTPTKAMNLGTAAHLSILGVGPELVVQRYDGRTKSGKAERADLAPLVEAGTHVVVTAAEHAQVAGMASALTAHHAVRKIIAAALPEVSAFWRDGDTWLRARYDLLTPDGAYDYKTTPDVDRRAVARTVGKYGYHQQADHYERGLAALNHPAADAPMRFICQETEPPYLVQVYEMDDEAREVAHILNDRAIAIFTECNRTGIWPGHDDITAEPLSLPAFYITDHADMLPDWFGSSDDMDVPA